MLPYGLDIVPLLYVEFLRAATQYTLIVMRRLFFYKPYFLACTGMLMATATFAIPDFQRIDNTHAGRT